MLGSRFRRRRRQEEASGLSKKLVSVLDHSSAAAEAYRVLRTNLLYASVETPPRTLMMTSTGRGEGRTTVCANLAASLAQAHKMCLVIDCDLRKPGIHNMFGLSNSGGLVEALGAEQDPQEIFEEPMQGLKVVTAGSMEPGSSQLLGSQRFTEFLERVSPEFDHILLDSPPVNSESEALVLSTRVDGVLLVVDTHSTSKQDVQRSVQSLEGVGATVVGTVVNQTRT